MVQKFKNELIECEKNERLSDALRKCEMILEKCTKSKEWEIKR